MIFLQGGTTRFYVVAVLLILGAGFFCWRGVWAADTDKILINEIQIYPTEYRFIELYNPNDFSINLTNWYLQRKTKSGSSFSSSVSKTYFENQTIPAHGYFVISRNYAENVDVVFSSLTLTEFNVLQLKNSNAEIIDKVGWGDAGDCEGNCAINPDANQSIQRKFQNNTFVDTNNNATDFETQTCPSPKAQSANCQTDTPSESEQIVDSESESQTDTVPETNLPEVTTGTSTFPILYHFGDVVINEFVADPSDGEVEFVELYNKRLEDVSIVAWTLTDASGAQTILNSTMSGGGAKKYFIIEKPKGNLNNSGDLIILKQGDTIIDYVAYGNWQDGNTDDNAPTASDPQSVARKGDGFNTFNNQNDFAITQTITKGAANVITDIATDGDAETRSASSLQTNYDYSTDIIISEIFPNPAGSDSENEFIELFNNGTQDVNLDGWILSDGTNRKYEVRSEKLEDISIQSQSYFVLYRKDSDIALNNTNDEVKLYQPLQDEPLQIVKYEKSVEDWSYSLENATSTPLRYVWSETVTPGETNKIQTINHPPTADFSFAGDLRPGQIVFFDSSDTTDADGDELKFSWDFAGIATSTDQNPLFIFPQAGVQQVTLSVSDGENEVNVEKLITLTPDHLSQGEMGGDESATTSSPNIIISEFLPNPTGADTEGEWIELQNLGDAPINLNGWKIDDEEGGSAPFTIQDDVVIESLNFLVFERTDTSLALNNTTDTVRLFDAAGALVDEVPYENPKEGLSYVRAKNAWQWTGAPTPGEPNIVVNTPATETSGNGSTTNANQITQTTLTDVRTFEPGDFVQVSGTVAVVPGTFGVQYFYILGSPGLQIYNSKKDFPPLALGDRVAIAGELSSSYGELRLKTKTAADISVIATSTLPEPAITETDKIGESMEGWLVRLQGEIVQKKGSSIWLDDGNGEVEIYIKQGTKIDKGTLNEGETATVIGIVTQNNDSYRVLPRSTDDVKLTDSQPQGEVLGVVSENTEWALAQNNKKLKLAQYLLILAGGLIVILAGLLWTKKI
jgi:DNA/RNA endonuclease YhcR with UshA esterase domain